MRLLGTNQDKKFIEFLSAEEEERLLLNTIKEAVVKEGVEEEKINIAKKMLE